jgi:hypothetical protein
MTVGVIESFDPTPTVISFENVRGQFLGKLNDINIDADADDDEALYIASDGGELLLSETPVSAPIVTQITPRQALESIQTIDRLAESSYTNFDVHFDEADSVIFEYDEILVAAKEIDFGSSRQHPEYPITPSNPTIPNNTE